MLLKSNLEDSAEDETLEHWLERTRRRRPRDQQHHAVANSQTEVEGDLLANNDEPARRSQHVEVSLDQPERPLRQCGLETRVDTMQEDGMKLTAGLNHALDFHEWRCCRYIGMFADFLGEITPVLGNSRRPCHVTVRRHTEQTIPQLAFETVHDR